MESKVNKQNLGWGILLICFGLAAITYLYTGLSEWINIAIFFLGGLAAFAVFWTDRSNWLLLIPVYVMWAVTAIIAAALLDPLQGDIMGSLALTLVGLPFLAVSLRNRDNWWALFPAFIMLAIALMLLLTTFNILGVNLIAPFILFSIAITFLVVYFINRDHGWALIPAYVMIVIGVMVGLIETGVLGDLLVPAYINLAIAVPFFVVYFRNKAYWWALIPGVIMGLVGLGFLLSAPAARYLLPVALIIAGVWVLMRRGSRK